MKLLRGIFRLILIVFLAANIHMAFTGKWFLYKAVWYFTADIDDYKIFDNRTVANDSLAGRELPNSAFYNSKKLPEHLLGILRKTKTIAVLAVQHDSVVMENYWEGYKPNSYSNSFSMAKSIIVTLVGIAIQEGKINSVDQPVGDFLPQFKEGKGSKLLIRHCLMMASGSSWDEAYANPFSITTEAYYGSDLEKTVSKIEIRDEPGTIFEYRSGDTEMLGLILEKATGMSVSQYASEKLWKPMQATMPALWSLDKEGGHEKCYCCFNSNARDFSRLGLLYLHNGRWNGKQIIDSAWCRTATTAHMLPDKNGDKVDYYGYQWWIHPDKDHRIFYARGIRGQYIIVIPDKDLVLVRLGERRGAKVRTNYEEVDALIHWALEAF